MRKLCTALLLATTLSLFSTAAAFAWDKPHLMSARYWSQAETPFWTHTSLPIPFRHWQPFHNLPMCF